MEPESSASPMTLRENKSLGLDCDITRRDFLNTSLLASGGVLLDQVSPAQLMARPPANAATPNDDWTGYGGVGDYATSNGNTGAVMEAGHQIRDGEFDPVRASVIDTGEIYDCVVVGGGISGLAAALIFEQLAGKSKTCLVLDNHPVFGGEAKRNEFMVDGHRLIAHQGSAFFPVPYPHSFIARFYDSIGLKAPRLEYQKWGSPEPEIALSRTPYLGSAPNATYFGAKFGHPEGLWLKDPWGSDLERAPISKTQRQELAKYQSANDSSAQVPQYPGDAVSRRLDSITLEQHLIDRHAMSRETIRAFLLEEGSGYGLGPDALSGYTAYAADMLHPLDISDQTGQQMFPDGNGGIARLITKTLIPESIGGSPSLEGVCRNAIDLKRLDQTGASTRIRLDSTAVWVKHDGDSRKADFVTIAYTRAGKAFRVKARSVVMAGGSWTTRHIVKDLSADQVRAYKQFYRSPCLMANVAVRNWRFLYQMGISGCQWYEGFGSYTQVRRLALCGADSPTIGPDSPVVLTLKVLFPHPGESTEQQGNLGRAELFSTPFPDYERLIRQQLAVMFAGSGFDPRRDIRGIILNRWGHAYLSPAPGFFFGKDGQPAPGEVLRAAPLGRIVFANTDLSGVADHRCSIIEANRAVAQLLDQVLES